jgi:hypothetical protein
MSSLAIVILIIIIIVILIIIYYCIKDNIPYYKLDIQNGEFKILNENIWNSRPIIPTSKNILIGFPVFEDDRYDCESDNLSHLYGGKKITKNEAWVIKGKIPHRLMYWSFGSYMLSDGVSVEYTPIESPINNKMIFSLKDGDEIVCIMSPNYKLAEYIATKIKHDEYSNNEDKNKHVIFRYFPIPNYNPNAYYNLIFNSYIHEDSSIPNFKVQKYINTDLDNFKFYPVQPSKQLKLLNKNTINETTNYSTITELINFKNKNYKKKIVLKNNETFSHDILYLDSGIIELKNNSKIEIIALDHSLNGKCLCSEILIIDDVTGKCYDNYIIGKYNPIYKDKQLSFKTIKIDSFPTKRIRIIERICVDLSTQFRPDYNTILAATVYVF